MPEAPAVFRAHSRDGRSFRFSAPSSFVVRPGDLIAGSLDDGRVVLGQVDAAGDDPAAPGDGTGGVIGVLGPDGTLDRRARPPFADLQVRLADADELGALQRATRAATMVGTWLTGATGPAMVRAAGFNRHTFLCGQSGSGKTYALGVLLERLLIDTDLRVVVLDPNADFVRLGETRPGADADDARRVTRRRVRVLRSDHSRGEGEEPLRMRFRTMPRATQAAVLRLDPVRDHEEYNAYLRFVDHAEEVDLGDLFGGLRVGTPVEQQLARRIENLGLDQWEVFALWGESAADVVTGGTGVTVMTSAGSARRWSRWPPSSTSSGCSGPGGRSGCRHSSSSTRRTTSPGPTPPTRRGSCCSSSSRGSRQKDGSTASGCCCRRSGPRRSTRRCSPSATTSSSCG